MSIYTLTQEEVHNLFDYDNGKLYWKIRVSQSKKQGDRAGYLKSNRGFREIIIKKQKYTEHHIIWLWHKGYSVYKLRHINGIIDDNRIENLTEELNPHRNRKMDQNFVRELFNYKDGELYWKMKLCYGVNVGNIAGGLDDLGYRHTSINGRLWLNHRLIFLYNHGYLPKEIDHIDRNPLNNRIDNLRESTHSQNSYNKTKQSNNASGYKGVYWYKRTGKWASKVTHNRKTHFLGYYDNIEDANNVCLEFRNKHHGEFANND